MTFHEEFDLGVGCTVGQLIPLAHSVGSDLQGTGAKVVVEAEDSGPMAGVEWLLPTGFVLFVAGKYLGAMATEAGKQHYPVVRDALHRAMSRLRGIPVHRVASSSAKLSRDPPGLVSVYYVVEETGVLKFVFAPAFDVDAVEDLLDVLIVLAGLTIDDQQELVSRCGNGVVFRYHEDTNTWRAWEVRKKQFVE